MRQEVGASSPASKPFRGRLQPTLLPSGWTPPGPGGQLWNVGPVHGPRQVRAQGAHGRSHPSGFLPVRKPITRCGTRLTGAGRTYGGVSERRKVVISTGILGHDDHGGLQHVRPDIIIIRIDLGQVIQRPPPRSLAWSRAGQSRQEACPVVPDRAPDDRS